MDLRLAPMAGVTNAPFRLVCREAGAGLLTSEEIDARALVEGNARTQVIAHYLPEERPIAFQLLGGDPDVLAEAARRLAATGADGIDLNMGCPVSKIVAKGQGAAPVMVGRGALGAPWIFVGEPMDRETRARIIHRHCALIEEHLPPRDALVQLKKHLAWYSTGLAGSARLRTALFQAETPAAVQEMFWGNW